MFRWLPTAGVGLVVAELTHCQPWLMQLIMEDELIKETFYAALAEIPAPKPGSST